VNHLEAGIGSELRQHGMTNGTAPAINGKADVKRKSLVEFMSDVEEETVDWLWTNRIPRGKLSIFDGDPELGKSTVALAIAAALSNGMALPFDKEPEAPLRSLIISSEDGAADTLKPRLRKLGADMTLVGIPHRERFVTASQINANVLDTMLQQYPAALLVLDPILAFANQRNTDKASDVRGLLQPLVGLAAKHKTAIILIRHLNKGTQTKALYRGQGSIDFGAIVRSAFIFAQDPASVSRRLMAHYKCNLAAKQPTLEYFIEDGGAFRWGNQTADTPDEALGTGEPKRDRESKQFDTAKAFLTELLSNGTQPSNSVKDKAKQAGISNATLWRAKEELGINASKERGTGEWWWRL
jgi:RecA-family ATPase